MVELIYQVYQNVKIAGGIRCWVNLGSQFVFKCKIWPAKLETVTGYGSTGGKKNFCNAHLQVSPLKCFEPFRPEKKILNFSSYTENGPGCIHNAQMFVLVVFGVFTSEFLVECKKMQKQKR